MSTKNNYIPTILIIGAGPGGLLLYHGIQKHLNKNGKNFNIKIFERDEYPKDRWQGYYVGLDPYGAKSLISCLPESLVTRLPEIMPMPNYEKESMSVLQLDHKGTELFRLPLLQIKSLFEFAESTTYTAFLCSRYELRDLMLEGVDLQWGKKCIGYDESDDEVWAIFQDGTRVRGDILIGCDGIHSPTRKQRLPHLQIFDYGITQMIIEATPNKKLMDRMVALNGNCLFQRSYGQDGDNTLTFMRLIPIETDITENTPDDQIHYRVCIYFTYYTHWDRNINVDDNNPQSVIDRIKTVIKQSRKPSEFSDILLELISNSPVSPPKENEKTFFRTYNPLKRRPMLDIDPTSIEPWESTRVTLLGDAVHAMSPFLGFGTNNAFRDADLLVKCLSNYENHGYKQCIQEYENAMRIRSRRYVLEARKVCLINHLPKGKYRNLFKSTYLSGKL